MVRFILDNAGSPRAEQFTTAPAVYLDHWALRQISEDAGMAARLATALHNRGGTLMVSWLNLIEFSNVSDESQARAAEALIEAILPHVFFLEVNPFTVIANENTLLKGGSAPAAPHADREFLQTFVYLRPQSVKPFTARNLFMAAASSDQLPPSFEALADTIIERTEALRQTMDSDTAFERRVRRLPSGPMIQRGTRYILRELARPFLIDRGIRVTRNHAIDLVHAVVPVAYCDFVLLDKHWEEQVERMRVRFADARMDIPLAKVYSGKARGVDRFISAVETYDI